MSPTALRYLFENGRLTRARYLVRAQTTDPAQEEAIYAAWRRHFETEHGAPLSEEWTDSDGSVVPKADQDLATVRAGKAKVSTTWQYDRNRLLLELVGGDGEFQSLRAYYEPLKASAD